MPTKIGSDRDDDLKRDAFQTRRVAGKRGTTLYLRGQSGTSETMKIDIEATVPELTIPGSSRYTREFCH